MDCRELKEAILSNSLKIKSLILKYNDNSFLCYQYIEEFIKNNPEYHKVFIHNLSEINKDGFVEDNSLYILDVDELKELVPEKDNLIVICGKISKNIEVDFVDIPKLVGWQIQSYMDTKLTGLTKEDIEWLLKITKSDIYRLENEASKIEMFNKATQSIIFNLIKSENGYSDLVDFNIFGVSNAILKNSPKELEKYLTKSKIEPMVLLALLIKNFKNVIDIQMNPKATAESLGMDPRQFGAVKYCCNRYSNDSLINIFEFLTGVDYQLKTGNLDMTPDQLTNYIIGEVFSR